MGLMLAEPGFHTRCFVEWDEHPRDVLIAAQRAGYFAPAPIWDDVTTFDGKPFCGAFDAILAGYPCQPFSQAGLRRGADDERHLWPDVARIISDVSPTWVFLENVAGHVTLGAEAVLRDLWGLGYTPAAGLFSAAETGATHERLRWFCVAHRYHGSGAAQPQGGECYERRRAFDGSKSMGNAPRLGRGEGRPEHEFRGGRDTATCPSRAMADACCAGLEGREWRGPPDERNRAPAHGPASERGSPRLFPPGPGDLAGWAATLATRPDLAPAVGFDDCLAWARRLAADLEGPGAAAAEPALRRMADGLAHRARALRLLGNGVHPLAAAHAWRSLASAHGLCPVDMDTADRGENPATVDAHMRAAE